MEESNKLPLKRVELSLTKFNEVAIPHHLDLLRQHKANIIKYEQSGGWARVRSEQTHARRVCAQLRALLGELEALRRAVRAEDLSKFDALTQRSRDLTRRAIVDYLDSSPVRIERRGGGTEQEAACGSALSTDSVGVVAHAPGAQLELVQLQVDEQEAELGERQAALRGWVELQQEVRALRDVWATLQATARAQREPVAAVAEAVERAGASVAAAREELAAAERLRAAAYGAGGAALGALAGGPVGLLIGIKAGAAALVAGSALGYWGARLLGARRRLQLQAGEGDTQGGSGAGEGDTQGGSGAGDKKTQ